MDGNEVGRQKYMEQRQKNPHFIFFFFSPETELRVGVLTNHLGTDPSRTTRRAERRARPADLALRFRLGVPIASSS